MTTEAFDVVIVGAGPAGASLACALGTLPLRVALIEAVPFAAPARSSYDDRSLALNWGARRVFESIDLWREIAAEATPIREIQVSDRGHCGAARMSAATCGVDAFGYVVENRMLGRAFAARLPQITNVELICPARLLAMTASPDAVHLRVSDEGGERALSARLIVGADGAQSAVRRYGGIDAEHMDYGQHAVIANVSTEIAHGNRAWERFTAEGPLALLPMSANRCALVWTVREEDSQRLLALPDAEFLTALQARFGNRLGRFLRVGARSAYPLALVRARSYVGERMALIGNAAHTLHPVAGQGFNLGLRDVAVLAELIGDDCARGQDPGADRLLRHYQRSRLRDQQRTVAFTDGLVRVFASDFAPLVVARNLGMVVLDRVPPLKRVLMRHAMGLAGRLPRLARGLPL